MANAQEMKTWLDANADKAGTPDYVKVTDAYSRIAGGGLPEDTPYSDVSGPAGVGMTQVTEPNAPRNIALRGVSNAVTAIPDLGVSLMNIGARAAGNPEIPYLSQKLNAAAGVPDMPADAPWYQRAGEGVLSGALGGIPGGVRGVAGSVIPSLLSVGGAEGGAQLGQMLGVDPQTMAVIGGALFGNARPVAGNVGQGTVAALYGSHGKPNAPELMTAADRIDVQPTGAALGDQSVQRLEQFLERQPGTSSRIMAEKKRMQGEIGAAADAVPAVAGATMQTPLEIGKATQKTAGTALTSLENRAKAAQQAMETQIGEQTPVNVAALDRAMSRIPGQTTSEVSDPITARLGTLRKMYPEPDPNVQGPPAPVVNYERLKDWRGNLLKTSENYPALTGSHATDIKGLARELMRDTAIQQGVPGAQFDATQQQYRDLRGQREALAPLTDRQPGGTTDYAEVYSRGPEAFDTNPTAQRNFADAVTAGGGNPSNILSSRFNDWLSNTLHWRNDSATAPIKFAEESRRAMDPETMRGAVGPQGAQILQDVAELARASHRPTVQGGASQALGDIAGNVMNRLVLPGLAGLGSHLSGQGPGTTGSAATAALIAHQAFGSPIDHLRATMLNSQTAANAMAGRPIPYGAPVNMTDLVASINALQGSTPRGPPMELPPITVSPPISR